MKWFEHQTDSRLNKKIRKIELFYEARGGDAAMAAIGRLWRLYEIVAYQDDNFRLPDDYGLDLLAHDLLCTPETLSEFLGLLSDINSIDADAWANGQRIYIPKLAERASEYTKRLMKKKKSEPAPANDPPVSGECPDTIGIKSVPHTQTQTQIQKTKKHLADLTSADTPPKANGRDYATEFEAFYAAYPNKKKPADARKAYLSAAKKDKLPPIDDLIASLEDQKTWPEWIRDAGRFISYPATWINGECWKNERTGPPVTARRKYADRANHYVIEND